MNDSRIRQILAYHEDTEPKALNSVIMEKIPPQIRVTLCAAYGRLTL